MTRAATTPPKSSVEPNPTSSRDSRLLGRTALDVLLRVGQERERLDRRPGGGRLARRRRRRACRRTMPSPAATSGQRGREREANARADAQRRVPITTCDDTPASSERLERSGPKRRGQRRGSRRPSRRTLRTGGDAWPRGHARAGQLPVEFQRRPFPGPLTASCHTNPSQRFSSDWLIGRSVTALPSAPSVAASPARRTGRSSCSPGSSGYQQATGVAARRSRAAGRSVRQFSGHLVARSPVTRRAFGQRGWNGQPGGGSTGDGTSPVRTIAARRAAAASRPFGTADRSAAVYGCCGCS